MAETPNIVPWGLHPLAPWIKKELEKRAAEVGMNTTTINYAGPKTPWVRFFSNGVTQKSEELGFEGFIMGGVHGFNDSYGLTDNNKNTGFDGFVNVLGLDALGQSHINDEQNSFPFRPPPSVDSVDVSLYGGQNSSYSGLCRKARINWKCYSLDQLEYLAPYFLTPKVTAVIEWGWNNYDPISLIDLVDRQGLLDTFLNGEGIMKRIEASNGNYDAMIGFIFDYGFSLNALGGYDCYTELVNANWLVEGQEYKSMSNMVEKIDPKTKKKTSEPKKSFVDFIEKDLNNLTLKDNAPNATQKVYPFKTKGRTFSINSKNVTIDDAKGASGTKNWLRMDLVQDILNQYFSLVFKDSNNNKIGSGLGLDMITTVICGHPAVKSTDINVLIPNKYAPKFITKTTSQDNTQLLSKIKTKEIGDYDNTFKDAGIGSVIKDKKLSDEYDDLFKLINSKTVDVDSHKGNSFPVFEHGKDENNKYSDVGMWGYLRDIYISVELLSGIVNRNESSYRILEELCNTISNAFCGMVQLKVVPHQHASQFSILDQNYNPRHTSDSVGEGELPRFVPASINSAYMTEAGLSVKISQEMANQMVAQSSADKNIDGMIQKTGLQQPSRFLGNDRLYEVGRIPIVESDQIVAESKETDTSRNFPGEFIFTQNKEGKVCILIENDKEFMLKILSNENSGKAIYINSPIMSGTKFTMTTLGIGGFTFLGQFTLDHVPKSYAYKNCVWQIADIKQTISSGMWTTTITADCRPLSYIRKAST